MVELTQAFLQKSKRTPFPSYFQTPKSVRTWIQIQFLVLVLTCWAICSLNLVFLSLNCRYKQPDTGRVQLEVSSPETRPFLPPAQTHNQPAAAPTSSQMPAMTRLSKKNKKNIKGRRHDNLDRLRLKYLLHLHSIHIFRELSFEKCPTGCWILSARAYLRRCIAGTEFFIFSPEFFDVLHQSFRGDEVLFLLPLESRCQVWNFTSKTKNVLVNVPWWKSLTFVSRRDNEPLQQVYMSDEIVRLTLALLFCPSPGIEF